jgi:hypothetical protein
LLLFAKNLFVAAIFNGIKQRPLFGAVLGKESNRNQAPLEASGLFLQKRRSPETDTSRGSSIAQWKISQWRKYPSSDSPDIDSWMKFQ